MSTKERMKERYDIGVVIARFQVDELHEAHRRLLDEVRDNHKQMIIMLGVPTTLGTSSNPLPFPVRAEMVREHYPNALITHIVDNMSDTAWSKQVDSTIRMLCPIGTVCLYGGRDSFIPHYHGVFPTLELTIIPDKEGKQMRQELGHKIINSRDFRAGIIYASQNKYPRVNQTVDIAPTKTEDDVVKVFMGRRKVGMGLRFSGGFVDPTDLCLEAAATQYGDVWHDVWKDPITDPGKTSKRGRIKLVQSNGSFKTVRIEEPGDDVLQVVFENGELFNTTKFDTVRQNANF